MVDPSSHSRELVEYPSCLKPCKYQVAGHLPENGKTGSLVDGHGRFYKPIQPGRRGLNEVNFYRKISSSEFLNDNQDEDQWNHKLTLLSFVPRFYDCVVLGEHQYLVLKDVVWGYRRPCVMDIKIGYRTWYSAGDAMYNERARLKDRSTTQSSLGFKICGWQVYDTKKRKFHRVSKSKCKTMSQPEVRDALTDFSDNRSGRIGPRQIYSGRRGVIARLGDLRNWFQSQALFKFYSSSVLIIYEGDEINDDPKVTVHLVDFAHTFPTEGVKDGNFRDGLTSLMDWLMDLTDGRDVQSDNRRD